MANFVDSEEPLVEDDLLITLSQSLEKLCEISPATTAKGAGFPSAFKGEQQKMIDTMKNSVAELVKELGPKRKRTEAELTARHSGQRVPKSDGDFICLFDKFTQSHLREVGKDLEFVTTDSAIFVCKKDTKKRTRDTYTLRDFAKSVEENKTIEIPKILQNYISDLGDHVSTYEIVAEGRVFYLREKGKEEYYSFYPELTALIKEYNNKLRCISDFQLNSNESVTDVEKFRLGGSDGYFSRFHPTLLGDDRREIKLTCTTDEDGGESTTMERNDRKTGKKNMTLAFDLQNQTHQVTGYFAQEQEKRDIQIYIGPKVSMVLGEKSEEKAIHIIHQLREYIRGEEEKLNINIEYFYSTKDDIEKREDFRFLADLTEIIKGKKTTVVSEESRISLYPKGNLTKELTNMVLADLS